MNGAESPYARLMASAVPRPSALVESYVRRGTDWFRKVVVIFAIVLLALGVLAGLANASGGHATLASSLLQGIGMMTGLGGVFFLGPVVLFWIASRRRLRHLLVRGEFRPGTVVKRYERVFRGHPIPVAEVEYLEASGRHRTATFQGAPAVSLSMGKRLAVIADGSSSVAIAWPPHDLALARRR